MTFLPLIDRELRVRVRGRAIYRTRVAVALIGILICVPMLVLYASTFFGGQAAMGHYAFGSVITTTFFLSCCAGLLTADSISRERREGTLSLLLLTRVRAFDVLLGAFGSVGINCLCALIAVVPVLMLPLLTGGVTGGEAFRKALVLMDTLFLSLAVGLWASARGRGWLASARLTVILLLLIIAVPPLCGLPGPLAALHCADDGIYPVEAGRFWFSIAGIQGFAWFLLIAAGMRLRRTMGEGDGASVWKNPAVRAEPFQPIEEGMDPVAWLMRRQRGVRGVIWAAILLRVLYHFGFRYFFVWFSRSPGRLYGYFSVQGMGLAISVLEGCLLAWAASRFFIETRRSGELEILLTTPEATRNIVSSQWNWLRSLLVWPVIVLLVPEFVINYVLELMNRFTPVEVRWAVLIPQIFGFASLIAGFVALFWLGLWQGFKARSQAGAVLTTVIFARGGSYLANLVSTSILSSLVRPMLFVSGVGLKRQYLIFWSMPQLINLLYYIWLTRWARRKLRNALAQGVPVPLGPFQFILQLFSDIRAVLGKFCRRLVPPGL